MNEFLTDEQQADRARNWLRENGVFIAAGIVLGLGGLFGWQQWEAYQARVAGEASVVWEKLRDAVEGKRFDEVNERFALLEKDYARTPYLDQARLILAQMHMDRNAPDEALKQLESLAKSGRDPQLRRVAELRVAQVMAYQGQYDEALTALGTKPDAAFAGLYHDLRGDILQAKGDFSGAVTEYELALADTSSAIESAYVQVKLDDARGSLDQVAASAPPAAAPTATAPEPTADGTALPAAPPASNN